MRSPDKNENPDGKSFRVRRNQNGRWVVEEWHVYANGLLKPEWHFRDAFDYRYQARRYARKLLKIMNTKMEYY